MSVQTLGSLFGWTVKKLQADVTLSTTAADVDTDLEQDFPAGAVVLSVRANIHTLVVAGSTSVKIGIGITTDEDKYGKTTGLTKNLKITTIPDWAVLAAAEDVQVQVCDTSGDEGDTAASAGIVTVELIWAELANLANQA